MGGMLNHLFSKTKTHILSSIGQTFYAKFLHEVLICVSVASDDFQCSFLNTFDLLGLTGGEARMENGCAVWADICSIYPY